MTDIPGTTRDLITESVDIEGVPVTLVDTAGWREAFDVIEREGVERGTRAGEVADLVIVVLDGSETLGDDDQTLLDRTADRLRIVVANKADRAAAVNIAGALRVSATRGDGVAELRQAIVSALSGGEPARDTAIVSNMRHVALLREARAHLSRACAAAGQERAPEEIVLVDLQASRMRFDEIVGVRSSDDVLHHIFEKFCIGK